VFVTFVVINSRTTTQISFRTTSATKQQARLFKAAMNVCKRRHNYLNPQPI